ncbi:MAG: calcium-binding protein [Planktotalea sp.]|uniref:calcium-binding protein n=1 Tax=Planktotalea sp. TaxID=2029877 RepID=UPI003C70C0EB
MMLILAGLLGMLALGSIMLIEPSSTSEGDDELADNNDELEQVNTAQMGDVSTDFLSYVDEDGATQTIENETTEEGDLLFGTNDADTLAGDGGDDNVMAGGGSDAIDGGTGNDVLHGNGGDDTLTGGAGFDALFGDQGDDALNGGGGNDTLIGNVGEDDLSGSSGNDSLIGGEGFDALRGGRGDDTLVGNAGDDTLDGGEGGDLLMAGDGNDLLDGRETNGDSVDFLNGGDGDDTIFAGAGDQVSGGHGADITVLDSELLEHAQIWDFESGQDTLVVLYDANSLAPEISISQDPDTNGHWLVQADGETVANIAGDAPSLSDISLIERT